MLKTKAFCVGFSIFLALLTCSKSIENETDLPKSHFPYQTTNSEEANSSMAPPLDSAAIENAPAFPFAVRDSEGKICILAKLSVAFTITYPSDGEKQQISVTLPEDAQSKGRCGTVDHEPFLDIFWSALHLSMIFTTVKSKSKPYPEFWELRSMELQYNTESDLFKEASNVGKITARTENGYHFFKTPFGKAYLCPSPEVIPMFNSKNEQVVMVLFKDMQLQVYDVHIGKFSPFESCSLVENGGTSEPFKQDYTIPIVAGTCAASATLILIGFALGKYIESKKWLHYEDVI